MSKKDKSKLNKIEKVNFKYDLSHIQLTKDQQNVIELFQDWFFSKEKKRHPVLRIGGYAGASKSTTLAYICKKFNLDTGNCMFVSYTGQAVNRLRQLGIPARTIHSSFMIPMKVKVRDKNGEIIKKNGIPLTKISWKPVEEIPSDIKLVIGDEWSFVPDDLEDMILRYNVPLLVFGDPLQLPPVHGSSRFVTENLDYLMTQIMRQNKDNDIVRLSMAIREDELIDPSKYTNGEVRFLHAQESPEKTFHTFKSFFKYADVIVSTTNKERQVFTDLYRDEIIHTDSKFPLYGEPLICRKNNWSMKLGDYPLTNGTLGRALSDVSKSEIKKNANAFFMDFKPDFINDDYFDNLRCDIKYFLAPFGDKPQFEADTKYFQQSGNRFEFAYVLTTHIVQGAEFDNVLFLDRPFGDAEFMRRLRYTAVTRARKYLMYMMF